MLSRTVLDANIIIIIVKVLGLNRPLLVSGAKKALIWALKGTVAKRPV